MLDRVRLPDAQRRFCASIRTSCRAACASASRSRRADVRSRSCCSRTNRRPRSTSPCRRRSWPCSPNCAASSAWRMLLVTHDLGVVAASPTASRSCMRAGSSSRRRLRGFLTGPRHPYSAGLLATVPRSMTHRPGIADYRGTPPRAGRRSCQAAASSRAASVPGLVAASRIRRSSGMAQTGSPATFRWIGARR